jgi:hypothetical protein
MHHVCLYEGACMHTLLFTLQQVQSLFTALALYSVFCHICNDEHNVDMAYCFVLVNVNLYTSAYMKTCRMCKYMYTCVCVCVMRTNACIYLQVSVYANVCVCMYVCICMHMYVGICICTVIREGYQLLTCSQVVLFWILAFVCSYRYVYACLDMYMYVFIHTYV